MTNIWQKIVKILRIAGDTRKNDIQFRFYTVSASLNKGIKNGLVQSSRSNNIFLKMEIII